MPVVSETSDSDEALEAFVLIALETFGFFAIGFAATDAFFGEEAFLVACARVVMILSVLLVLRALFTVIFSEMFSEEDSFFAMDLESICVCLANSFCILEMLYESFFAAFYAKQIEK